MGTVNLQQLSGRINWQHETFHRSFLFPVHGLWCPRPYPSRFCWCPSGCGCLCWWPCGHTELWTCSCWTWSGCWCYYPLGPGPLYCPCCPCPIHYCSPGTRSHHCSPTSLSYHQAGPPWTDQLCLWLCYQDLEACHPLSAHCCPNCSQGIRCLQCTHHQGADPGPQCPDSCPG